LIKFADADVCETEVKRVMKIEEFQPLLDRIAGRNGLDAVAVVPLANLEGPLEHTLSRMERGLMPPSYRWTEENTRTGYGYKNYGGWAKAVIVAAKSFYVDESRPEDKSRPFGRFARYTWRNNYTFIVRALRSTVSEIIRETGIPLKSKVVSNYTSIPEKVIFSMSGIAGIGKNCTLISPVLGSYFNIGEAFIDLTVEGIEDFQPPPPDFSMCGSCRLCMDACPAHAFIDEGVLDINLCFQYLSENVVPVPGELRRSWGDRLYGCSTCTDVCPFNSHPLHGKAHDIGFIGTGMDLIQALTMSDGEWMELVADNQIGRRDRLAIIKNGILALGNSGYEGGTSVLTRFLHHDNTVIRSSAAWALGESGNGESMRRLEERLDKENDPAVSEEISSALGR